MFYDLTELRKYSGGDKEFELEMLQTFLNDAPDLVSQMKMLLTSGKEKELRQIAHKYKSTVGIFEMIELWRLLDMAENNKEIDLKNVISKIEALTQDLVINLEQEKSKYIQTS